MGHHSKNGSTNVRTLQAALFVYDGGADSTSTNTTNSDNTVNCIFSHWYKQTE